MDGNSYVWSAPKVDNRHIQLLLFKEDTYVRVVWGGSKNIIYQKIICLKEIVQHIQNIITILLSLVTVIGIHVKSFNECHQNLHFDNE